MTVTTMKDVGKEPDLEEKLEINRGTRRLEENATQAVMGVEVKTKNLHLAECAW